MASFAKSVALVVVGGGASVAHAAFEVPIDFNVLSEPGAAVNVVGGNAGGTLLFPDASRDFRIQTASDPALVGIKGTITPPAGGFAVTGVAGSHGDVSGTGTFTLYDADAVPLSAELRFVSVLGVSGIYQLNPGTAVNLTNWAYAGNSTVFQNIRDSGAGTLVLNWRMTGTTLLGITSSGDRTASYGGSFQTTYIVIPEPAWIAVWGLALPLLARNRR